MRLMGNYENLKNAIADVITTNGNNEITGAVLRQVLQTMVSSIGENSTFGGVVTPDTNVGTPDQNVFYVAKTPGVYQYMGGVTVKTGEIVFFTNTNNQWVAQTIVLVKHIHTTETDDTTEEIVICNNDETEVIVKINNEGLTAKKIFNPEGKEIEPSGMYVVEDDPATLEICDEEQRPILRIDSEGNVNTAAFNSLNIAKNKFNGKTMLYIGDSISTGNIWYWKGYVKGGIGLNYVNYNINDTVNVTPAVGGITIRPHNDDDTRPMNAGAAEVGSGAKSIWWRCCNKRLGIYDFDCINLFGGTNDTHDNNLNVGTIDDTPLLDTDVEDLSTLDLSQVSFASAFMGCIEMLQRDFPGKQIFICTLLYSGYARTPDVVKIQMLAAQKYGLIVVPFYYSELNSQNYQWLCDGFHPKQVAARIMEKNFIEYINL